MKHWKIIVVILALVALSGFAGLRLGLRLAQRAVKQRTVAAETWHESAMRSLDAKLKLSAAQKEQLQVAMDRAVDKLKGTRQQALAEAAEIITKLLADVDAELTPEQRGKFRDLRPKPDDITLDLLRVEPRKK